MAPNEKTDVALDISHSPPLDSSCTIRFINPLETADWDERVGRLPDATFFHSSCWARVLKETYGFQPVYFVGEQDQRLKSLLPLIEVNSWLTGRRGISLPFTDACPPLCPDAQSFRLLFDAARQYGIKRSWKHIEFRGGKEFLPDAPTATRYVGHLLSLEPDTKALFSRFSDSTRRAVRKAEKSELSVEFSRDIEAVRTFHTLLCLTRKRHGVPPQPFNFFEQIHRHVLAPGKGWVVLARHQGRPVAGAVFFHFGQSTCYKFGASDESLQHLRANNLIMAKAIEWYAQNGFGSFDFGRTSIHNTGLQKFKLGWGSTVSQIEYVRLDPRKGVFLTAHEQEEGLSQRIFSRLPIPLTRLIGSILYRHAA